MNAMHNVKVYDPALCDYSGTIGFVSDSEQSGWWIAADAARVAFEARCWTFDDFMQLAGLTRADVL